MPSFLESMSFFFHFSGCIIGPSIEYMDFKRYIYLEKEYQAIPIGKVALQTAKQLFLWFLYSAMYLVGNSFMPVIETTTEEFYNTGILYKIYHLYVCCFFVRCKYYCGWTLGHTSMVFSGITYNKKIISKENGKEEEVESYDKAVCFDFWGVENEPNIKKKLTVS